MNVVWYCLECVGVVLMDLILRLYMAEITCCCNVSAICETALIFVMHPCSVYSLPCVRMMPIDLKAVIPTAAPSSLWLGKPPLVVEGCQFHACMAPNGNIAVNPVSLHFEMTIIAFAKCRCSATKLKEKYVYSVKEWHPSIYYLLYNMGLRLDSLNCCLFIH